VTDGRSTQAELVERARAGDHDAFERLVRPAIPRLHGAAKLILRSSENADDALQEALLLTIRSCHRSARQGIRYRASELDPERSQGREPDFAQGVHDRDLMARQLGRLPVDQRTVIVLHFYLDVSLVDAAEILDIPIGTVKSRLHRGLETMRIAMSVEPNTRAATGVERTS
jgi:RNA polymerase sigma-70 factor (ECF subfamily)